MSESVNNDVAGRLEYLRRELRAERISWGELAELQSLADRIDPGDLELLEAAGVPEHADEEDAMQAYVVTIENVGGEYRAKAYKARTTIDGEGTSCEVIEARATIFDRGEDRGALALDNEAWQAGADALAAVMPEPEGD